MTPEDRSREYAPGEWDVPSEIRVLLLVPEAEPENWPVLPDDPEPRLERSLRIVRNGIIYALVVAACWGLLVGFTWATWRIAGALT